MDIADAWLRMALIPGLGPITAERLLESAGGDPAAVFSLSMERLLAIDGIGGERARRICDPRAIEQVQHERAMCQRAQVTIVCRSDPAYPKDLLRLHDPPLALWMRGTYEERDRLAVSVVGPRRPSSYGHRHARRLCQDLVGIGACIVSGLARGVDTVAHQAAVAVDNGRTVAVLGSGFAKMYPEENRELAEQIVNGHGCVISEFPYDTPPSPGTFPRRNRIVAALSMATLVVEASSQSGALITARLASELGKPVLVLPGPIDASESVGANQLIRDGATLIGSFEHILDEIEALRTLAKGGTLPGSSQPSPRVGALSGREKDLYKLIDDQTRTIDDLVPISGFPASAVSATLLSLELKRLVRKTPTGFVRAV